MVFYMARYKVQIGYLLFVRKHTDDLNQSIFIMARIISGILPFIKSGDLSDVEEYGKLTYNAELDSLDNNKAPVEIDSAEALTDNQS